MNSVDIETRSKPGIFCYPPVLNDIMVGFFDEAEKDGSCGAGMVLKLEMNHSFLIHMDVG